MQSLLVSNTHQLLKLISYHLQILIQLKLEKQNQIGGSLPAVEKVHQASFLSFLTLLTLIQAIIISLCRCDC